MSEEIKNQRTREIQRLEEVLRSIRARETALLEIVTKYKYGIESDPSDHSSSTTSPTPTLTNTTTSTSPPSTDTKDDTNTSASSTPPKDETATTSTTSDGAAPTTTPKKSFDLLLDVREVAPELYDIMNWSENRIAKDSKNVKRLLSEHNEAFVTFLRKSYEQGNYKQVREYFEKFGANNSPGEAVIIYVNALHHDSALLDKIGKIFNKDQPPGTSPSQPLHVSVPSSKFGQFLSLVGLIISILILMALWTSVRGGGGIGKMLNTDYTPVDKSKSKVTFADVQGNHEAKEELLDLVEFLKDPQKFATVKVPKGVLMVGPPGTGKTLMARALAGEAGVPFISASGSEFEEVFVGLGARRIRQLFEEAKKQAPCIIFIDEIDAVGGSREKFLRNQQQSLNQLLVELDGFTSREGIILIGATNMPGALDPALIRPGRFDRKVYLGLPTAIERKEILDYYLSKHKLDKEVDSMILARQTAGMSGADIENMVNWAAVESIKQDLSTIDMHLLEVALMNVSMGREKKSMIITDKVKKITAYHEGGHAIVALFSPGAPEIRKATLIPRGDALGMVNYLPSEEHLVTKTELIGQMQMAMGGRAAEELIFGTELVTSGASSDFEGATRIANSMVTKLGMSDKVGHVYIQQTDENGRTNGFQGKAEVVEEEVQKLLEHAYSEATRLLKEKEKELHLLATALLQYETLDKEEIMKVIKGEPLLEKDAQVKRTKELKAEKERKKQEDIENEKKQPQKKTSEEWDALQLIKQKQHEKNEKTI